MFGINLCRLTTFLLNVKLCLFFYVGLHFYRYSLLLVILDIFESMGRSKNINFFHRNFLNPVFSKIIFFPIAWPLQKISSFSEFYPTTVSKTLSDFEMCATNIYLLYSKVLSSFKNSLQYLFSIANNIKTFPEPTFHIRLCSK